MSKRADLTEQVKDGVVRDYLRGDKAIVIQMEYKISPGVMYRILHARKVELRRAPYCPEEVEVAAPTEEVGRFRAAVKELVSQSEEEFGIDELLVKHVREDPVATIKELVGDREFTVGNIMEAARHIYIQEFLESSPEFERVGERPADPGDDRFQLRK